MYSKKLYTRYGNERCNLSTETKKTTVWTYRVEVQIECAMSHSATMCLQAFLQHISPNVKIVYYERKIKALSHYYVTTLDIGDKETLANSMTPEDHHYVRYLVHVHLQRRLTAYYGCTRLQ